MEDRSITKEKARRERSNSRRKTTEHQETSSYSKHKEGSEDAYEDLNSPYKRITRFKYHRRASIPPNIRVYEGNKDPEDHLGIFSAAAEQEEWLMPIWCKMFRQTLGGVARNWFDDLDPKSVDNFEELSQKFLEEFSQQKSSHIRGVPPVIRISAFMHGHGHPELAKKLNDKIPKMVDEMFERVKAFIRGEVAAGSAEMDRPSQRDKGGHNTKDCYQLKKQIEEVVASRKLTHLVKDICRTNQRNGSQGRNNAKVINMIREGGNRKRPFKERRLTRNDGNHVDGRLQTITDRRLAGKQGSIRMGRIKKDNYSTIRHGASAKDIPPF
ncbi:hypothetical protein Tco_0015907 [Tanacetum coccineum]